MRAISSSLEENVVAAHLKSRHSLDFEVHDTLLALRQLAEESYENRSLTYGLIIAGDQSAPKGFHRFPRDFLSFKRYRALSDGYRTAFKISQSGHLLGLEELAEGGTTLASGFYPEWGKNLVASLVPGDVGVSLTRQGDVLVFDSGGLRFTYRRGHWQYWNHAHVTDLLRNRTRIQHVAKQNIPPVVRAIYRAALDISFRRSGGLFVLVRAERNLRRLVPRGDAIGDRGRLPQHRDFDRTLRNSKIHALPRAIIAELAALDGAVVINNGGTLLAYGAVLITGGKFGASEGSRTKAASSASQYGLAVKISSDGDIAFYEKDNLFLSI